MLNEEHHKLLKQGGETWNQWRAENPEVRVDLRFADLRWAPLDGANLHGVDLSGAMLIGARFNGADLSQANLSQTHLSGAYLTKADLTRANLYGADLSGAHLRGARLNRADLTKANLSGSSVHAGRGWQYVMANLGAKPKGADLSQADLSRALLTEADLSDANLSGADLKAAHLEQAQLVNTNLQDANLTGCHVYGISAWNVQLEGAIQTNIVITPDDEPIVTVDNLEVAQFIYLLINNEKIRHVIDTITTKVVLILGRFTPERKDVLDAIREELRNRDLLPILFDFDKPATRNIHETVTTLARMARFVIADITDPKSIPQELVSIVQELPSLPVQPILQEDEEPWGMYDHIKRYPWVLAIHRYKNLDDLLASLGEDVIDPAEAKAQELQRPT